MDELDITGMTWFGALATVILLMISYVRCRKRRFDTQGMTRSEIINLVNLTIFSQRDRELILRRLIDGLRMEQLAEEFQLSVPQVKRIVYKSEDILAKHTGQK
jgi:DNA-directed RNA polymerase specialized sigma24 family protein